jgi:hypothetical protein
MFSTGGFPESRPLGTIHDDIESTVETMAQINEPFYVRYYSGHTGRFGHGIVVRKPLDLIPAGLPMQSSSNLISEWWATAEVLLLDTQTIPIIEMMR